MHPSWKETHKVAAIILLVCLSQICWSIFGSLLKLENKNDKTSKLKNRMNTPGTEKSYAFLICLSTTNYFDDVKKIVTDLNK